MKYECIKEILLPLCDEDGCNTNKFGKILKGSFWEKNDKKNIIGGEVHLDKLTGNGDFEWIEITKKTLSQAFFEV